VTEWLDALANLSVVEIGRGIAASWAGRLLAGLGAAVVKIEGPAGDDERDRIAAAEIAAHHGLFEYLNQGKQRLTADLGQPAGFAALRDRLAGAVLLIEDLDAGGLERIGASPAVLRELNPALSVIRVSPYGQTGPYAGWAASELTVQAAGGWVGRHGIVGVTPFQIGGAMPEYGAGAFIAASALAAVFSARASGAGVDADISVAESMHCLTPPFVLIDAFYRKTGGKPIEDAYMPLGAERCRDGWVGVSTLTGQHWSDVCACLEVPEYATRREDVRQDPAVYAQFRAKVEAWLGQRTAAEVVETAQAFRVPATEVSVGTSILDYPQWRCRPFFEPLTVGDAVVQVPGLPWRVTPSAIAPDSPPTAGRAPGFVSASASRPLAGLRVLDLGTNIAVPVGGSFLGTAGADVIKVESVQRPDSFRFNRTSPADTGQWWDSSPLWQAANFSKRDLTLDLTSAAGRQLLLTLAASADIVLENYSVRVFDQFRLDHGTLSAANPGLILIRVPGYGLDGPMRDYVGFGNTFEQTAGLAAVTGPLNGPPVTPGGYIDPVVAAHVATVALAAVEDRARTGRGRLIEIPQIEVGAAIAAEGLIDHQLTGQPPRPAGNRCAAYAPQGVYECADGWIALTVRTDDEWARLRRSLAGQRLAADDSLADLAGRQRAHDRIDQAILAWAAGRKSRELVDELQADGIAAARVQTPERFTTDPHLLARGLYHTVDQPVGGPVEIAGWPLLSPQLRIRQHRFRAPWLGEHNAEILRELGGLDAGEVAALTAADVIGTVPLGVRG
jgi:crotonobetainyl-CoA:carnitine CoA-transferase CaiB-like acyl-CoA transferase